MAETFILPSKPKTEELRAYYYALYDAWGPQHWWPAHTQFEVIVGAYLTQNTSWKNVELALARLRVADCLGPDGIRAVTLSELEALVRPAGYFRQKARSLKAFVAFLDERYNGSLEQMFARTTEKLREELLSLKGVGPETADSILLYAGQHPVFVVDAYTRRVLERHNIISSGASYEEIRALVERTLGLHGPDPAPVFAPSRPAPSESAALEKSSNFEGPSLAHKPSPMSTARRSSLAQTYNDLHGLIVVTGKLHCAKAKPKCDGCPLQPFLRS